MRTAARRQKTEVRDRRSEEPAAEEQSFLATRLMARSLIVVCGGCGVQALKSANYETEDEHDFAAECVERGWRVLNLGNGAGRQAYCAKCAGGGK